MPLKLVTAVKDKKIYPALLKFSVADHSDEQVSFIADTSNNETLYKKWVSDKSPKQVNLHGPIQKPLDALAAAKKWGDMTPMMKQAKEFVAKAFDSDVMPRFEKSQFYLDLTPANPEAAKTAAAITQMEKDMVEYTKFFTTAMATVKAKGKPSDKIEVNRMFDSARLRHDKVHVPFTERLQKDKGFTKAAHGPLFAKKEAFSKLWADYRKLLGR